MSSREANIDRRLLKPHGLPVGVLDVPIVLYRTGTTGVFHTVAACRGSRARGSSIASRTAVTFAPVDAGPIHIGKCCIGSASVQINAAIVYTKRLEAANGWLTNAKNLLGAPPSVIRKGRAVALAAAMPTMWAGGTADELTERMMDVRAALIEAADSTPDQFVAAAAWAMAGVPGLVNGALSELVGPAALNVTLFDAATKVAHGTLPPVAIDEALATLRDTQADVSVSIDRLPSRCRFDRAQFDHPRDWALAEWAAAFEDEIASFAPVWLQWLACLNRTLSCGDDLVVAVLDLRPAAAVLREVSATCFSLQTAGSPNDAVALMPAAMLDAWAAFGAVSYASKAMPARDAKAVLPLAAKLRQDTYSLHPVAYTMQAAVAVISPGS